MNGLERIRARNYPEPVTEVIEWAFLFAFGLWVAAKWAVVLTLAPLVFLAGRSYHHGERLADRVAAVLR